MARKQGVIKSFTSKGKAVSGYSGRGSGIQVGVRDPNTGRVIRGPRPTTDAKLVGNQAHVRVVNGASQRLTGKRTVTLGMGAVGQESRF